MNRFLLIVVIVSWLSACGNSGDLNVSAPITDSITLDATAPNGGTIIINNGATFTNSQYATLKLTAAADVTQMQFSKDGVNYFPFEPFAATRVVTLLPGDGLKTMFVRFKDAAGNVSAPISDSITIDMTPPSGTITFTTPDPSAQGSNSGSEADSAPFISSAAIIAPKEMLNNHSTTLGVSIVSDLSLAATSSQLPFSYHWSASAGTIEGSGSEVKYTAPGIETNDFVTLSITDGSGRRIEQSVSIMVHPQFVILKADDFAGFTQSWKNLISYVQSKGIKASFGVIGYGFSHINNDEAVWIKALADSGSFEFWCHGYDHAYGTNPDGSAYFEFKNTPYEQQKDHLLRSMVLAGDRLNLNFHSFGAPFNATDINTIRAIDEIDEMKVWMYYGTPPKTKKFALSISSIDHTYNNFLSKYDHDSNYLVMPLHPAYWKDSDLDEFKRIVDYLIEQGVRFVLPYEYYQYMNPTS